MSEYYRREVARQAYFRTHSCTISDAGRSWTKHEHLLAPSYERENLYPSIRGKNGAHQFFRDRRIKWQGSRSMVSSQVVCVNFLLPLSKIQGTLAAAVRAIDDDVRDIVPICHEGNTTLVEFEWIGLDGPLEEGEPPTRGEYVTSVDAFMIAETEGDRRAYLMEWKYTEKGGDGEYKGEGRKGEVRWPRYAPLYSSNCSSFGTVNGVVPMNELLYEPFYQIMRNRLLADRVVANGELGVSDAKVVVVVPEENTPYREATTSPPLAKRFPNLNTVDDVMQATLKNPDAAFKMVTPNELLEAVVSECGEVVSDWAKYIRERYGW